MEKQGSKIFLTSKKKMRKTFTIEDIHAFNNADKMKGIKNQLKATTTITLRLHEISSMRTYLIIQLLLQNVSRPGPIGQLSLKHLCDSEECGSKKTNQMRISSLSSATKHLPTKVPSICT